jgi:hypothetical protein
MLTMALELNDEETRPDNRLAPDGANMPVLILIDDPARFDLFACNDLARYTSRNQHD